MSDKRRAAFYEREAERTLLAWYACRLHPDYRRDWRENRHMVEWLSDQLKALPLEDQIGGHAFINHKVTHWLGKLGHKWDFDMGRMLLDPALHIPYLPPLSFANCTTACENRTRHYSLASSKLRSCEAQMSSGPRSDANSVPSVTAAMTA